MISVSPIPRVASGALAVAALALLPACDRLVPQTDTGTMGLLKSGSEKVCIAPEVQHTLRGLILPRATDVSGGHSLEDKQHAVDTVALSYALTTLQSFDKAVSRASCNTTIHITGTDGKSSKFVVGYQISPSADNAGSFVVDADTDDAKAFASDLVGDAIDDTVAQRVVAQQDADEAQARAKLLATVGPKWLIGTWIGTADDAAKCANGDSLTFAPDHTVEGKLMTARWSLDGDKLHIVGSDPQGQIDNTGTIVVADAVSFKLSFENKSPEGLRRCSTAEVQAAGEHDSL